MREWEIFCSTEDKIQNLNYSSMSHVWWDYPQLLKCALRKQATNITEKLSELRMC